MYEFDKLPNRAGSDSVKWSAVSGDVIPMWVADMDFPSPNPLIDAVRKRASHPYFGYPWTQNELKRPITAHYQKLYGAEVDPEWIVFVPSVIPGVVTALEMTGGAFMYSTPMYDHIRALYKEAHMPVVEVPMKRDEHCRFTMDIPALEKALTPEVKSLILCSPHNPVGRVYTRKELEELQCFCEKHGLLLISDEIHCELDLEGRHIPFFAVSDGAKKNSITLSSAGKICNIPGLPMGFAIIPDETLREKFIHRQEGLLPAGNVLTLAAYEKAYDGSCDGWKNALRDYLRENRDLSEKSFAALGLPTPHNEGTYLLWINCSSLGVEDPAAFFRDKARVKVSPGKIYGDVQCVRFNFACPRAQLTEALDRIAAAVTAHRAGQ